MSGQPQVGELPVPDEARPGIAIAPLARRSWTAVIEHTLELVRLGAIPLLVLAALGTALLMPEMSFKSRLWASLAFQAGMYLMFLPVVTSWHRLILQGPGPHVGYRFGHEEFLYTEMLLGIGLMVSLFLLVSGLLFTAPLISGASWIVGASLTEWTCRMFAWLMSFAVVCRFVLVLPAAALGKEMRIAESGFILRGNVLRFIAAYFLVLVLPQSLLWLVGDPSSWILRGNSGEPPLASALASFYVGLAATLLFWALSVAVLSLVYRSLIPSPHRLGTSTSP